MKAAYLTLKQKPRGWIYCPDPDAALIALILTRRGRARIIFDIHEEFHKGPLEGWAGPTVAAAVSPILRRIIRAIASRADIVTAVNQTLIREYADIRAKGLVVRNTAQSNFGAEYKTDESHGDMRYFHGKASRSNGTPHVLEAVNKVDSVRVTMIPRSSGESGTEYWRGFADAMRSVPVPDRIDILDAVPHDEMAQLLDKHDVGLIAYGRTLGVSSLPNRLFEYMARGLAVMVPEYSREIVPIVTSEQIGVTADFEDSEDIARKMKWLRDNPNEVAAMGARARTAFLSRYSWDAEFQRLLRILDYPADIGQRDTTP